MWGNSSGMVDPRCHASPSCYRVVDFLCWEQKTGPSVARGPTYFQCFASKHAVEKGLLQPPGESVYRCSHPVVRIDWQEASAFPANRTENHKSSSSSHLSNGFPWKIRLPHKASSTSIDMLGEEEVMSVALFSE